MDVDVDLAVIDASANEYGNQSEYSEKNPEKDDEQLLNKMELRLIIIIYYFLGTACFLPHGFYVTANKYWMYKFRDPQLVFSETVAEKTNLQKDFTAYANVAGNFGMGACLALTILFRKLIGINKRIIGSIIALLSFFGITLLFTLVNTDSWQLQFFWLVLGIDALLHCASAILIITLLQLATYLPSRCLAAQYAGQSLCGVLAAAIQIVSLSIVKSAEMTGTLYYAVATGSAASILIVYLVISNKSVELKKKMDMATAEKGNKKQFDFNGRVVMKVYKKMALIIIALVLYLGTVILHPGLTTLIESDGKGTNDWSDTYFLPVCVFLLYNITEFSGREISNYLEKLKDIRVVLPISIIRLVLFPLIILCNIQPRKHLPVVFHEDGYFIFFIIAFALFGGFVANCSIVIIPKYCKPQEQALAKLLIALTMIICSIIFSFISGVFVEVI